MIRRIAVVLPWVLGASIATAQQSSATLALIGATIVDGRGGAPIVDATIVIADRRIVAVGPKDRVVIPHGTRQIDVSGRFVVPGFVDANVHLTPYNSFDTFAGPDTLLVLAAVRGAREMLGHGITTARDTYGYLAPLLEARDRLAREDSGPTLLVAGNIIGWGGPWSFSFTGTGTVQPPSDYARTVRDGVVLGMGENLVEIAPDSLARLIATYIDRGVDFVPALFAASARGHGSCRACSRQEGGCACRNR